MLARLNAIEIIRGTEADIDDLRPLGVSVHHAHRAAMPELGPFVRDDETWRTGARVGELGSLAVVPADAARGSDPG